jgi:hypothetical protein
MCLHVAFTVVWTPQPSPTLSTGHKSWAFAWCLSGDFLVMGYEKHSIRMSQQGSKHNSGGDSKVALVNVIPIYTGIISQTATNFPKFSASAHFRKGLDRIELMRPPIPSGGFSSFIAFYSCSRFRAGTPCRSFSTYRTRCLQNHPIVGKKRGDKVCIKRSLC